MPSRFINGFNKKMRKAGFSKESTYAQLLKLSLEDEALEDDLIKYSFEILDKVWNSQEFSYIRRRAGSPENLPRVMKELNTKSAASALLSNIVTGDPCNEIITKISMMNLTPMTMTKSAVNFGFDRTPPKPIDVRGAMSGGEAKIQGRGRSHYALSPSTNKLYPLIAPGLERLNKGQPIGAQALAQLDTLWLGEHYKNTKNYANDRKAYDEVSKAFQESGIRPGVMLAQYGKWRDKNRLGGYSGKREQMFNLIHRNKGEEAQAKYKIYADKAVEDAKNKAIADSTPIWDSPPEVAAPGGRPHVPGSYPAQEVGEDQIYTPDQSEQYVDKTVKDTRESFNKNYDAWAEKNRASKSVRAPADPGANPTAYTNAVVAFEAKHGPALEKMQAARNPEQLQAAKAEVYAIKQEFIKAVGPAGANKYNPEMFAADPAEVKAQQEAAEAAKVEAAKPAVPTPAEAQATTPPPTEQEQIEIEKTVNKYVENGMTPEWAERMKWILPLALGLLGAAGGYAMGGGLGGVVGGGIAGLAAMAINHYMDTGKFGLPFPGWEDLGGMFMGTLSGTPEGGQGAFTKEQIAAMDSANTPAVPVKAPPATITPGGPELPEGYEDPTAAAAAAAPVRAEPIQLENPVVYENINQTLDDMVKTSNGEGFNGVMLNKIAGKKGLAAVKSIIPVVESMGTKGYITMDEVETLMAALRTPKAGGLIAKSLEDYKLTADGIHAIYMEARKTPSTGIIVNPQLYAQYRAQKGSV